MMANEALVTHTYRSGSAGTLMLLHGFPVDSRMWDAVVPHLPQQWGVMAVDLPGLGHSRGVLPQPPSLASSAQLIVPLIDALPGPVVVAGLSMGGYVTMELLRRAGDRLAGVVFLDTKAEADTPAAAAKRLEVADQVEREASVSAVLGMADATVAQPLRADRDREVALLAQWISEQDPAGVAWSQRAMASRDDSFDVVRGWDRPALVLRGEHDAQSDDQVMRALAQALPQGQFVEIPAAGHMTAVEQPGAVAREVTRFLADL